MHIEVIATIGEARSEEFLHKTVIVIDVLRATSTMVTALANGSSGIVPVETVLKAKELYQTGDLLGGERYCKKIPGFDFGNSPLEYSREAVQHRRIIMTTTNGTRGIHKAMKAEHVLAGSLMNGRACADAAIGLKRDTVVVCSGTQDVFSLEDGLCAGLIVHEITQRLGAEHVQANDFGIAMKNTYVMCKHRLLDHLLACCNGKKMKKSGFLADIIMCSQANTSDCVPILKNEQMVLLAR